MPTLSLKAIAGFLLSQRQVDDTIGADAARVGADAPVVSTQVSVKRQTGTPRRHVPRRLVDRRDDLRERAGLAALDRHDVRTAL